MKILKKAFIFALIFSVVAGFAATVPSVARAEETVYDISEVVSLVGSLREYEMTVGTKNVGEKILAYGESVKFAYKERSDKNQYGSLHFKIVDFGRNGFARVFANLHLPVVVARDKITERQFGLYRSVYFRGRKVGRFVNVNAVILSVFASPFEFYIVHRKVLAFSVKLLAVIFLIFREKLGYNFVICRNDRFLRGRNHGNYV